MSTRKKQEDLLAFVEDTVGGEAPGAAAAGRGVGGEFLCRCSYCRDARVVLHNTEDVRAWLAAHDGHDAWVDFAGAVRGAATPVRGERAAADAMVGELGDRGRILERIDKLERLARLDAISRSKRDDAAAAKARDLLSRYRALVEQMDRLADESEATEAKSP